MLKGRAGNVLGKLSSREQTTVTRSRQSEIFKSLEGGGRKVQRRKRNFTTLALAEGKDRIGYPHWGPQDFVQIIQEPKLNPTSNNMLKPLTHFGAGLLTTTSGL